MEEAASKFMHHHGAGSRAPGQVTSNDKDDDYIRNKHYGNQGAIDRTNEKLRGIIVVGEGAAQNIQEAN